MPTHYIHDKTRADDARAEREATEALLREFSADLEEAMEADEAAAEARLSPAERAERDAREREIDDLLAPLNDLLESLDDTDDDQPEPKPELVEPEPEHIKSEHGFTAEESAKLDALLDDLDNEDIETPIDDDVVTPIVTESEPVEQPEYGVEVTLDDLDPDEVAEVKAMLEAPGLCGAERAEIDALLDELDTIDEPEPEPTLHDNDNAPASFPQPITAPETGAEFSTSFPQKLRRRSLSRDREVVKFTRGYRISKLPVSTLPICHTSSTPTHTSLSTDPHDSTHPLPSDSLTPTPSFAPASRFHLPTAANDNEPHLRIWENSTDYIKLIYANRALADHGTPYHFTLNFGPKVAKAALKAKRGIRPFIADRLQNELKKISRDGAFWFVLDVTPSGRVHVHGGVGLDPSQEGAARAILHKVAGKWGNKHHKERQVDLDQQTDVDGWIDNYNFRKARARNLGETPLYIARPLRQIARENYERDRAIINSQQKPTSTISSSSTSPAPSSPSFIMFAAPGVDHSPRSSPVAPAGLAGVKVTRLALRRSWSLPVCLSKVSSQASSWPAYKRVHQMSCQGL